MRPGAHLGGVIFVDQPTFDEGAQDAGSHPSLHVSKRRRIESVGKGGMKADARRVIRGDGRLEYPVDDATVKVHMLVQAGAEPVDEGDRPDPGTDGATGTLFAQAAFHHGQENAQHRALQGRIALKEVAQPLGHGEHPLPHRQRRKDVIDQVRRGFRHAPRIAGWTHATTFTGVGDQEIVLTLVAVSSGEAVGEDAAFEIATKGALDMGRRCFTVLAAGEFQPGFEVGLDDAIPQRLLGTATLVALGCGRGA